MYDDANGIIMMMRIYFYSSILEPGNDNYVAIRNSTTANFCDDRDGSHRGNKE